MDSYTIDSLDDLTRTFEAIKMKAVEEAASELRALSRQNEMWKNPRIFVNGRPYTSPSGVPDAQLARTLKDFSTIIIVPSGGPVQKAVDLVFSYVISMCMRLQEPTGFYARNFRWFVNGQDVGMQPPDLDHMGLKGNVQLVNTTGYASPLEFHVPGGILYGAARAVNRVFGYSVALKFGYAPADAFGVQAWKPGTKNTPFMAVPIITMGHPSATFNEGRARALRRPGVRYRKRLREEMTRDEKRATRKKRRQEEGGSLK